MVDGPEVIEDLFAEEASYGQNNFVLIFTTVLMGLITVAAAWSGFQATKWHGEMANSFMAARAVHDEMQLATLVGNQEFFLDIHVFLEWLGALKDNRPGLAAFYYERMRDELRPVVEAWMATDPLENPEAPQSPFVMPDYVPGGEEDAGELKKQFEALYDEAIKANRNSEDYVLITVILASGLFFTGIATRLRNPKTELTVSFFALAVLGYTVYSLATFPVLV